MIDTLIDVLPIVLLCIVVADLRCIRDDIQAIREEG